MKEIDNKATYETLADELQIPFNPDGGEVPEEIAGRRVREYKRLVRGGYREITYP
jgi:hypothetical protein